MNRFQALVSTSQCIAPRPYGLASYDRKICSEPRFDKGQYAGLTRDLTEYLRTLKVGRCRLTLGFLQLTLRLLSVLETKI